MATASKQLHKEREEKCKIKYQTEETHGRRREWCKNRSAGSKTQQNFATMKFNTIKFSMYAITLL